MVVVFLKNGSWVEVDAAVSAKIDTYPNSNGSALVCVNSEGKAVAYFSPSETTGFSLSNDITVRNLPRT